MPKPDMPKPDMLQSDLLKPDVWTCGNNKLEGTEACDGSVPANRTCKTEGFTHGAISCNYKTCTLNTSACKSAWPKGKNGPLRIGPSYGLKKKVLSTGVMDYSELIIEKDGVLELQGGGWVVIGVNGDVKIHGQIVTRTLTKSGLIKATVPLAGNVLQVSHDVKQSPGGKGGKVQITSAPAAGATASGNGGGGASYKAVGGNAAASQAGIGGAGDTTCFGGAGAFSYGAFGQTGGEGCSAGGGGGGGGFKGYHGGLLHLQVRGNVSGSAKVAIDASGQGGGNGGRGGHGCSGSSNSCKGGGGGGGGAGGSGGKVSIRATGSVVLSAAQVNVAFGAGGKGGVGGQAQNHPGGGGAAGLAGKPGVYDPGKWVEK